MPNSFFQNDWNTVDTTPTWTPLTPGGVDLVPNAPTLIAPAVGRLFIVVNVLDTDANGAAVPAGAKVWLGYGVVPQVGKSDWIIRNGRTDPLYFAGDVYAMLVGHNADVRVTWQEWAAG